MTHWNPVGSVKNWASRLQRQILTLFLAGKHPGTPWYAKVLAACVVAYAVSPIDLIPDFIPVLGHLDDLLLLPAGIFLVIKLIPRTVWDECTKEARMGKSSGIPKSGVAAGVIIAIWVMLGAWLVYWLADTAEAC